MNNIDEIKKEINDNINNSLKEYKDLLDESNLSAWPEKNRLSFIHDKYEQFSRKSIATINTTFPIENGQEKYSANALFRVELYKIYSDRLDEFQSIRNYFLNL